MLNWTCPRTQVVIIKFQKWQNYLSCFRYYISSDVSRTLGSGPNGAMSRLRRNLSDSVEPHLPSTMQVCTLLLKIVIDMSAHMNNRQKNNGKMSNNSKSWTGLLLDASRKGTAGIMFNWITLHPFNGSIFNKVMSLHFCQDLIFGF